MVATPLDMPSVRCRSLLPPLFAPDQHRNRQTVQCEGKACRADKHVIQSHRVNPGCQSEDHHRGQSIANKCH